MMKRASVGAPLKILRSVVAGLTLAAAAPDATAQPAPSGSSDPATVRAGTYHFEPNHSRLVWSISHHGFSHFLGLFPAIRGDLTIDPATPSNSHVEATIPIDAVITGLSEFDGRLKSMIFQTAKYPTAEFRSTRVTLTSPTKAEIVGNLTFMGQTKPITVSATFNRAGQMGRSAIVGFDGRAVLHRSSWGMSFGVPDIGDDVTLEIEAEFVPA